MTSSRNRRAASNRDVALVLGSGGARGMAHIGIVRELDDLGYRIASISGCSIGALIGGIYAAGKLEEYESWVSEITKFDVLRLLDFAWARHGLVKGDRIINALVDIVGDRHFDDLPIPFAAVATDIATGQEVWFRSGRLFDAIRASISLPLFFTPFRHNGAHLIDGGVVNPVPIEPAFSVSADMTVAVNLGGRPTRKPALPTDGAPAAPKTSAVSKWISGIAGDLLESSSDDDDYDQDWGAYDVAYRAFDAMQGTIARLRLAAHPPDEIIEIPRNLCGTLEFDRASEIIAFGRERLRAHLSGRESG